MIGNLHIIKKWFGVCRGMQNGFLKALLSDDLEGMNDYMNEVSGEMFSSFDTGKKPSEKAQPERFYHGFVLGLLAQLQNRYVITSNREERKASCTCLGRYDIMIEPKQAGDAAFIIEFKVVHAKRGETLEDGVKAALQQIEGKRYEAVLLSRGIEPGKIRKYGFAFDGSQVLIGRA